MRKTLRGRDSHVGYESLAQRFASPPQTRLRQGYAVGYTPARWHRSTLVPRVFRHRARMGPR